MIVECHRVEVKLCIGLHGVCVLGLTGDDHEIVDSCIERFGVDDWYESLPPHKKPIEGIYRLIIDVNITNDNKILYEVVESFVLQSLDLAKVKEFVVDDSLAATYQTLGQYRRDVLKKLAAIGN